jgi:hypothetical protein
MGDDELVDVGNANPRGRYKKSYSITTDARGVLDNIFKGPTDEALYVDIDSVSGDPNDDGSFEVQLLSYEDEIGSGWRVQGSQTVDYLGPGITIKNRQLTFQGFSSPVGQRKIAILFRSPGGPDHREITVSFTLGGDNATFT